MKKIGYLIGLFASLMLRAGSFEGVYDGEGDAAGQQLKLLRSGHAMYGGARDRIQMVGTWKTTDLESVQCAVIQLVSIDVMARQVRSSSMCMRKAENRYEIVAAAPTFAETRTLATEALSKSSAPMCAFRKRAAELSPGESKQLEAQVKSLLAMARELRRQVKVKEMVEEIKKDPRRILSIDLHYPSEAEKARYEDKREAFSDEQLGVAAALMLLEKSFTEEVLNEFVEKCDWIQGDVLVFSALANQGFSAETLRKFAPRVEALIGTVDERYLCLYYYNPKTPVDVIKTLRARGGYGEFLSECVSQRLTAE